MSAEYNDRTPPVSVIVAVRNEEECLDHCLESIISLDYPKDKIEIILVDGMSTDKTMSIIESWIKKDDRIRALTNPDRIVSTGMNIGLKESRCDLILWTSGHVLLKPDYLRKCLDTMEKTSASAVGGILETVGTTPIGRINAAVLSNRFGVGGGAHRVGNKSGWVQTVTMALYRKDAIIEAGGWDEALPRSQDNDLHDRMNKIGRRSYMMADVSSIYLCRETFGGLLRQAWQNGYWNIMLTKMGRRGFNTRHFVPMIFVGCFALLIVGSLFSAPALCLLISLLMLYAVAAIAVSISEGIGRRFSWQIPVMPFWFLAFHLSYGFASWVALFSPTYKPEK